MTVRLQVLWDVSVEEGRDLYGPDYMDVWTIDKFHQIGASDIECDHLHGEFLLLVSWVGLCIPRAFR